MAVIAALICGFMTFAGRAAADEWVGPTTQAKAYNAEWVPYLDPPEKPAAVCLVDSGVNVTPDTPADSPTGPILKRLSLDGGPGTAANDTWEGLHGTRMAFVGAAPINGWGAVGFWPGARIVSIRAMAADQTVFGFDNYSRAMALCRKWSPKYRVVAVNLSMDCSCEPTEGEMARLENETVLDHAEELNVVAAAGNRATAAGQPANAPGVFAVAAGGNRNSLCAFSNRGPAIDVIGPGCDIDLADSATGERWADYWSGTSGAAISTSITLALLRSYRPDLGWRAAEDLVVQSSARTTEGRRLDLETLFKAAGLGGLVDDALARVPRLESLSAQPAPTGPRPVSNVTDLGDAAWPDAAASTPYPLPRVRHLRVNGRRLKIAVSNRPAMAYVTVVLEQRRGDFGYSRMLKKRTDGATLTLRLPKRSRGRLRVRINYVGYEPAQRSATTYRQVGA